MRATHLLVFLLLQLVGSLCNAESSAGAEPPAGAHTIRPTRESIYQHLATEMKAALGAEEHVRGVFEAVAGGMRDSVGLSVVPTLRALVDGVVERAEDAWIQADDAGLAPQVKHCIDGAEGDAQQVAKRALEKVGGCIEGVDEEGQRRSREAARLLNAIEDVSKRFVLALETCIKDEEAKEASAPEAPASDPAAAGGDSATEETAPEAPAVCPLAAGDATSPSAEGDQKPTACPKAKAGEQEGGEERTAGGKPKCSQCKKALEKESSAEEAASEETAEYKGKKGKGAKEYKGKDKSGKWKKEDGTAAEENIDVSESEKSKHEGKDKGKYKKGKDSQGVDKGQDSKKTKDGKYAESFEDNIAEVKEKKDKKSGKKEEGKGKKDKSGEEGGEGKKSRKKRDLSASNDEMQKGEEEQQQQQPQQEPEGTKAEGAGAWPTEGATPEERRVIACLRSPAMQPLVDEKTRAYQRLQAVLKRTSVRQEEAPACVGEHVRKAELKVAAIKQRMAACTARHLRHEL